MLRKPFWGLVRQNGPWKETEQDRHNARMSQPKWQGSGVGYGGTLHTGHNLWDQTINPRSDGTPGSSFHRAANDTRYAPPSVVVNDGVVSTLTSYGRAKQPRHGGGIGNRYKQNSGRNPYNPSGGQGSYGINHYDVENRITNPEPQQSSTQPTEEALVPNLNYSDLTPFHQGGPMGYVKTEAHAMEVDHDTSIIRGGIIGSRTRKTRGKAESVAALRDQANVADYNYKQRSTELQNDLNSTKKRLAELEDLRNRDKEEVGFLISKQLGEQAANNAAEVKDLMAQTQEQNQVGMLNLQQQALASEHQYKSQLEAQDRVLREENARTAALELEKINEAYAHAIAVEEAKKNDRDHQTFIQELVFQGKKALKDQEDAHNHQLAAIRKEVESRFEAQQALDLARDLEARARNQRALVSQEMGDAVVNLPGYNEGDDLRFVEALSVVTNGPEQGNYGEGPSGLPPNYLGGDADLAGTSGRQFLPPGKLSQGVATPKLTKLNTRGLKPIRKGRQSPSTPGPQTIGKRKRGAGSATKPQKKVQTKNGQYQNRDMQRTIGTGNPLDIDSNRDYTFKFKHLTPKGMKKHSQK
jgi:hypothetical protein